MSRLLIVLFVLVAAVTPAIAQEYDGVPAASAAPPRWSEVELENLVAPIALYPDPLLAQLLPAATESDQVVLAARLLRAGGGLANIDAQSWDDAVKALARYPEVLSMMEARIDWTRELGDAFTLQPQDVMNAIQRLRARALAAGNLATSPQAEIVTAPDLIEILPAVQDTIYVPYYQPEVVYFPRPVDWFGPVISFGRGSWCDARFHRHFDWRRRTVWLAPYRWQRPGTSLQVDGNMRPWQPRNGRWYSGSRVATAQQAVSPAPPVPVAPTGSAWRQVSPAPLVPVAPADSAWAGFGARFGRADRGTAARDFGRHWGWDRAANGSPGAPAVAAPPAQQVAPPVHPHDNRPAGQPSSTQRTEARGHEGGGRRDHHHRGR